MFRAEYALSDLRRGSGRNKRLEKTTQRMRNFIIYALYQTLGRRNQRGRDDGACSTYGRDERGMEENAEERDCLAYVGVSWRMILNQLLEKDDVTMWTVFSWFGI